MIRVAVCLIFAGISPAHAADLEVWGETAGWEVLIDTDLGNGCLISSEFEDGSTVRIGIDPESDEFYVQAFNEAWGDIQDAAEYTISYSVDGQSYEGTATGLHLGHIPGVDIGFDDDDFLVDIALKQTLRLSHQGVEVMAIDLTGSHAALLEAIACQEAQD